jgi:chorismate mutase/prephenate dehydratase
MPIGDDRLKNRLSKLRRKIDEVDGKLLELLNERAKIAVEVGEAKKEKGGSFYAPSREDDIVRSLQDKNPGPFPSSAIRPVWKEIISASLSLEQPLTVAYLGPQASFTHQACRKHFGLSALYLPVRSISEVFDFVEKGKADFGVIPVENTTEGAVSNTLDRFLDSETKIVGEVMLRISLNLMNKTGKKSDITKVYSHPHALPQCREWLEAHLPEVPTLEASSTAQAALMAAEDPSVAAVAGQLAGELYGLETVEAKIEDNPNNFTRFLVIGKEIPEAGLCNKTSLLFAIKDQAGALYHMLQPFDENGVNLTKIESRPMKRKAWEYVFFLDCEGHVNEPALQRAIEGLSKVCQFVKVLGSYPCGERPE